MNIDNLNTNAKLINTERVFNDLSSALKIGCTNTNAFNVLSNELQKNCKVNTVEGINYLYSPYSRGGGFKKSMDIKEKFCSTCNGDMKGGCFTCIKGKTTLNAHYNIIVVNLPKLYKKYKLSTKKKKSVNNLKKKGGNVFESNGAIKMEHITNTNHLHFDKYTQYHPFDINSQISLLG
jgi:hypothetical protein